MTELNAVLEAILSFAKERGPEGRVENLDRPKRGSDPLGGLEQGQPFNGSLMPFGETVRATQARSARYIQKRPLIGLQPVPRASSRPFTGQVVVASLPAPVLPGIAAVNAPEAAKSIAARAEADGALEIVDHPRIDNIENNYRTTRGGGLSGYARRKSSPAPKEKNGGAPNPRLSDDVGLPARAALASGASPAVLKVISSIHYTGAGALVEYMGTRETKADKDQGTVREDIPVYTQDGRTLTSKAEQALEVAERQETFRDGYNLTGASTYEITLSDESDTSQVKAALGAVFGNKPFLYKLEGNKVHVIGLTDADPRAVNADLRKMRSKGVVSPGELKTLTKEQVRIVTEISEFGLSGDVRISAATAKDSSTDYALQKFIRCHRTVVSEQGTEISLGRDPKELATGIRKSWSSHMRVRCPVNAYHVVFTARAGTDPLAVIEATKSFLDEAVQDRKWMISHHPDTGHVHVHAMIAARDVTGKPLRITKATLRQWRSLYAEKARERGIALVAVNRRETASTRPYNHRQLATVMRATLKSAIEWKRSGALVSAQSVTGSEALKIWSEVALETEARFPAIARAARGFEKTLQAQVDPHLPMSEAQNLTHNIVRGAFRMMRAEVRNIALMPREFEKREEGLRRSFAEFEKMIPAERSKQVSAIRKSIDALLDEVRPKGVVRQQSASTRSTAPDVPVRTQLDIKAEVARLKAIVDPEIDKAAALRNQKIEQERAIKEQSLKAQKDAELKAQQAKDTQRASRDKDNEQGR